MSILSFRRKGSDCSSATTLVTAATIKNDRNDVDNPKGSLGLNLLYSPTEPYVDFVFVHGLGGGSRKTWSKTSSIAHYWPQEWLPKDPAFEGVRVHSFGYDSDWAKGKENCLNIHHIGKSLLGELSTSPSLGNAKTSIVLIGHSMGGLVIKKAHILARQTSGYEILSERLHTIFFLATPHRGSDSAKLLNNILQMTYSSRAYVADLERGSGAIQSINDEFRNYSADVVLWSFYETQMLKVGLLSSLIVNPDSAILGYPDEKQMPMNADHRSICKFDTITDPNYVILRNALASTVDSITNRVVNLRARSRRKQLEDLKYYLEVPENSEEDLVGVEEARMSGTCGWFSAKENYIKWSDSSSEAPHILWVNGRPAAGKSVLAGYVIRQLQERNVDCSYFFFKHGDKSKSRLACCLRSLAFQMACSNSQVREVLLGMLNDGIRLEIDNERTLWQKLFSSGILQIPSRRSYWVIDALDECINFAALFGSTLARLNESSPLRILITSRSTAELEKRFSTLDPRWIFSETIAIQDTLPDIERLVEAGAGSVLVKDDKDRAVIVEKILRKAEGCFLWTVLVLRELSASYGEEEINQALEDIPRDMEPLYRRTLESMTSTASGRKLTKAILTWATCSTRPLTTKELEGALRLDINDNFPRIEECILAVCGHLVMVDRLGRVQMVHETAREFLLGDLLDSEFAIKKKEAHTRIARACLTYLTGEELKPPRTGRRVSTMNALGKRADFSIYACSEFSYHLAKADPLANDIWVLVNKFLQSNVLSWIEIVAETRNFNPLIRAAKHLRVYLESCSAVISPLGRSMHTVTGWTTDFVRIVAKFADALTTSPSAIHSLVLPFCPTESSVYKITRPGRRLSVVGLSNVQWDDRLSCIDFHQGQASAVCHGDDFLAVGLTTGTVALYHAISCQEYKILNHGEPVRLLQCKEKSALIASCGIRTIKVWDTYSGQEIHVFEAPSRVMSMVFEGSLLTIASVKNYLASWDLENRGAEQANRFWSDTSEPMGTRSTDTPCAISIAEGLRMLAVAYSGRPITLWDLDENAYYGNCGKKLANGESSTHMVTALVLNPNPDIGLLAVSYLDGDLVILDPFNDEEMESLRADCHTLTSSPDGRLLAGGAGAGTIQIYEFDTLRLLYRVKGSNFYIKQLAFSRDGLHLADVRGSHCNVWEPVALLRGSVGDDSSEGTSSSFTDVIASDRKARISAMILHPGGEIIFSGRDDGSVSSFDMKTGAEIRTLYHHKSLVRILTWWAQGNIIMSVDVSNGICAWTLKRSQREGWVAEKSLFNSRLDRGDAIVHVLVGEAAGKFIVSTKKSDHLWTIAGKQEDSRIYSKRPGTRRWIQHQQSPFHMICVEGISARVYTWTDWSEVTSITFSADVMGLQLKSVIARTVSSNHRLQVLLEFSKHDGSPETLALQILDGATFDIRGLPVGAASPANPPEDTYDSSISIPKEITAAANVQTPLLRPQLAALAHHVTHVVGFGHDNDIIFLDTRSWICSADLGSLSNDQVAYARHFFLPYDWFAGTRDMLCAFAQQDIIFARNDRIAVIKGGFEHVEKVVVGT